MKTKGVTLLLGALGLVLLIFPPTLQTLLSLIFPPEEALIYPLVEPGVLVWDHLSLVLLTSLVASLVGFLGGIVAWFSRSPGVKQLIIFSGTFLQTIPPMALLALLIPLVGFGNLPVFWALIIFGILPVFHHTHGALGAIPTEILQSAQGIGFSRVQIFFRVQLPLARGGILSGVRTSLLINIGTAAIGATMGAGGLGRPILAGITQFQYSYLIQGALTSGILAILADAFMGMIGEMGIPKNRGKS